LIDLFQVTIQYATQVTAIYVSCYAFGRLIGGLLAEKIGVFLTYNILIFTMAISLIIAPQSATYMPHTGQVSSGIISVVIISVITIVIAIITIVFIIVIIIIVISISIIILTIIATIIIVIIVIIVIAIICWWLW
jgi:hypothetical protein